MKEKIETLNYYIPFVAWVVAIALVSVLLVLAGFAPVIVFKVSVGFVLSWFLLLIV